MSQRNTPQALKWLKHEHDTNSREWRALCLKLCRSARNIPAVFPSAFAAQQGTPMRDRVKDINKVIPGMVMYFDDPNDSNKWGHIATVRAKKDGELLVWTNDALRSGGVDTVNAEWFLRNWGDRFQFASTSLNGFNLILPRPPVLVRPPNHPEQVPTKAKKTHIDYAIHRLRKSMRWHEEHDHPRYVKRLKKEIADLQAIRKGRL